MGKFLLAAVRVFLAFTLAIACIPAIAYADSDPAEVPVETDQVATPEQNVENTGSDSSDASNEEAPGPDSAILDSADQSRPSASEPHANPSAPEPPSATEEQPVTFSAPDGFTELTNVQYYPSNPFVIRIYSDGLRCGKTDSEKVTFKFVPETTADELTCNILSVARQDQDGWNCVYDTSFGQTGLSSSDSFSFNFVSSGIYSIDVQVIAKDLVSSTGGGEDGFLPQYSVRSSRIKATFTLDDLSFPSTEKVANDVAQQCLDAGNRTDYEKALWLHDWLLEHCRYDHGYHYANAEGALIRGIGTCEAYHRAYVMLLNRVGVDSGRITGNGHVWTAVKMDGEWYQVDVTWDDIDYEPHSQFPEERHLYFGLTDTLMGLAHSDHAGPIGGYASNSLANNYLVKSGAIEKYSTPYTTEIQQKLDAGERSFSLAESNSAWPESLNNAKQIVNRIAAYDLAVSPWSTNGKSAKLIVEYANGTFSIRAIVDGEIDSFAYYPGLHTKTGALRYGKSNGKYAQNEWITLNGQVYYFRNDGSAATFAQVIDGKSYYFWSNGVMASSRIWNGCYYDADGAMLVNSWFNIGGARYHAGDDGKLARGTVSINGKDYYFWSNYQMAQNALWNGHIYRIDGVMAKGRWYNLKGARYYIKEDGSLTYGNVRIDGKDYHFWSNAQMATNAIYGGKIYGPQGYTLSNTFFDYKGERYYAKFDGSYAIHAQRIDGEDYYFWSNGIMVCNRMYGNHYYLSNGVMAKFCWVDNEQYWVDKNGIWVPDMPAKVGWQNPYGYYQVSSKSMHMPAGYYATPSRINPYSSRGDCVEAFVNRAWDYIGTPYIWNYSDAPGVGVDCIGLVYQCAYACGMDLGEFNPYDHWITGPGGWHSHDANNMWNYGAIQRLSLGARQRGDLIFWRGHVAIYLGGDRIIEAYPGYVRECSLWAHSNPIGVGRIFL